MVRFFWNSTRKSLFLGMPVSVTLQDFDAFQRARPDCVVGLALG